MDSVSAKKSKKIRHNTAFTTREMVLAGMFAAVLAVISQLSIPTPAGVPVTIQVFGVALVGAVLGWKLGLCSVLVYILIGAAGLPVFANFGGGIRSLIGLTGGYIWAWPVMAVLCGIRPGLKKPDFGSGGEDFALSYRSGSSGTDRRPPMGSPFRRHDRRRCICLFYGGFCAKGYCDHHIGSYCKRAGKTDD